VIQIFLGFISVLFDLLQCCEFVDPSPLRREFKETLSID
jgi:hypothetical protein